MPSLVVTIFDDDGIGDDSIGACTLPVLPFDDFAGGEVTLQCNQGAGWMLVVRIEPA